ncbi:MAG: DM13 domain-containing protein [Leptolyngbyaceae cyanobacterium RM1_1_2]|nr:DM13 domain-containing protein [Leptolyngbyaceae cyanobacterium RM1_1_2]
MGQTLIALGGTFVAAEAPTTGTAQIIQEDGHRYLVLDSAFSTTDQAPDLHVILETAEVPPSSYTSFGSFVNLGGLQSTTGEQRYPIPDSLAFDLAEYKSVSIWCRTANATMGYAVLGANTRGGAIR